MPKFTKNENNAISNNWSMYRNHRPIFTPFFLTPIIRTLKTERGGGEGRGQKSLKFRGGARSLGRSSFGEGQITRDLAPEGEGGGGKSLRQRYSLVYSLGGSVYLLTADHIGVGTCTLVNWVRDTRVRPHYIWNRPFSRIKQFRNCASIVPKFQAQVFKLTEASISFSCSLLFLGILLLRTKRAVTYFRWASCDHARTSQDPLRDFWFLEWALINRIRYRGGYMADL